VRRLIIPLAMSIGVLSGCSSPETSVDPSSEATSSSTAATVVAPIPNANYSGDLVGSTGVSGRVTFKTSAAGELIDPVVVLETSDYVCNGGNTITNGTQVMSTIGALIAVVDGTFAYDSTAVTWKGTFATNTSATGTVEGNLISPNCEFGPFNWAVEFASMEEPMTTTTLAAATTATTQPVTTTTNGPVSGEYAELCTLNQGLLDRTQEMTPQTESRVFWEAQRDDKVAMVNLVPADLRADMAMSADAWTRLVDLLSAYDYNFEAMVDAVGTEPYTSIFTPNVNAAEASIQEFVAANCTP
jgi:hypothetical protein